MKKILLSIALIALIRVAKSENTSIITDSLRSLLKTSLNDSTRAKTLNTLSAYLILADQYQEALKYSNEALSIAVKIDFLPGIASAYRKIGVNYTQQGDYARAIENLLKSMRINERLNNKEEIFKLNNNIGNAYYSQGNYSSALAYFMRAYAYNKNDGLTNENIGIVYMEKGSFYVSLKYLNRALDIYYKSGDDGGVSNMLNNIGTIYECRGELDSALLYYNKSLIIKKMIGDQQGIIDATSGIGDALFRKREYLRAIDFENEALKMAVNIGYLISAQQTEKKLNEIYDQMGDAEKAYEHYKNYIAIRDSLYNEEQTKKTVRAEMNFDFEKKQAIEKAVYNEQIKRQQIVKNSFIIGFIIVIIFSTFLFRGYRKTRKQKDIINQQKILVEHKNQEITDSINYAQKIQRAILPSDEYMNKLFPEHLVIYKPKDIVSGDFYWSYSDGVSKYIATADCTGHSIPGAMMSMIGASLLNEIVIERGITSPDMVLNALRDEIIKAINHEGADEERKDGMDISFIKITGMKMECACANNPIYIIRDGELIEIKSNRFPVGKYITHNPFTLNSVELQKSDTIYTLSDGFVDQFSEKTGKKLMAKRFKQWIAELSGSDMNQIKAELESRFSEWIGSSEQIDDVSIVAIRI